MNNLSIGIHLGGNSLLGALSSAVQIAIPQDAWIEGDSYAGHVNGGLQRGGFSQTIVSTGVGGSTMTDAVARVATNRAANSESILIFVDGIYEDYTDAATAATNLDNIAANAGDVPWIYITPFARTPDPAIDPESPAKAAAVRVIAANALAAYPDNVLDLWPLVEALAQDAQDDTDVANGFLPRSAYSDPYHLSDATWDALAPTIIAAIEALWQTAPAFTPTGTPDTILGANLSASIDPAAGGMLQTIGGAAATADGDRIQSLPDQNGGDPFINADLALRPTLRVAGDLTWIEARSSFLNKTLPRSGSQYMCAAVRTPTSGNNLIAAMYESAPYNWQSFYEFHRWQFLPEGLRIAGSDTAENVVETNLTDIYVVEVLATANERTIVLHREGQYPVVSTSSVDVTVEDTAFMSIFGVDGESGPEGRGDIDLYLYNSSNAIPTTTQRNNLVALGFQAAGLNMLPPAAVLPAPVVASTLAYSTDWTDVSDITFTRPTGVVEGRLLMVPVCAGAAAGSIIPPDDSWSLVNLAAISSGQSAVFMKTAEASEPTTYTFTGTGVTRLLGAMLCIQGHDPDVPINARDTFVSTSNSTNHEAPTVTTTAANCLLLRIANGHFGNSVTYTPDAGVTELLDISHVATGNDAASMAVGWDVQTSSGGSTNAGFTSSFSMDRRSHTIAIAPADPATPASVVSFTTAIKEVIDATGTHDKQIDADVGDGLLAFVTLAGTPSDIPAPTGWTRLGQVAQGTVMASAFFRTADTAAPTEYAFPATGSTQPQTVTISRITSADNIVASAAVTASDGDAFNVPVITAALDNSLQFVFLGQGFGASSSVLNINPYFPEEQVNVYAQTDEAGSSGSGATLNIRSIENAGTVLSPGEIDSASQNQAAINVIVNAA